MIDARSFFEGVDRMDPQAMAQIHRLLNDWSVGPVTIAQSEVTYLRLDDKEVTIPAVTIWRAQDDGLLTHLQVFYDPSPIFAP